MPLLRRHSKRASQTRAIIDINQHQNQNHSLSEAMGNAVCIGAEEEAKKTGACEALDDGEHVLEEEAVCENKGLRSRRRPQETTTHQSPPMSPTTRSRKTWHTGSHNDHMINGSSNKGSMLRRTWHGHHPRPHPSAGGGSHSLPSLQTSSVRRRHHSSFHLLNVWKPVRQGSVKFSHHIGLALGKFFRSIEEFMFPRIVGDGTTTATTSKNYSPATVRGGVLLEGCETAAEHYGKISQSLQVIRDLHSQDGLRALGIEYRVLPCEVHRAAAQKMPAISRNSSRVSLFDEYEVPLEESTSNVSLPACLVTAKEGEQLSEDDDPATITPTTNAFTCTDSIRSNESVADFAVSLPCLDELDEAEFFAEATEAEYTSGSAIRCHLCMQRLYHVASDTLITADNRKHYIADGDMYEDVARLCQEYAFEVMCQEGNLEWATVAEPSQEENDNKKKKKQPICVMITKDHPLLVGSDESSKGSSSSNTRPTLMIATGRGKVRAGIFSRQHLMCSGLESGTAIPMIRDALKRHLNVMVVDHNVNGEADGFVNFEKSMDFLWKHYHHQHQTSKQQQEQQLIPQSEVLYVLSHSASGGHLARYLLDKSPERYLPHIRAIAFTDSTHSVQWAKEPNNHGLRDLLESPKCIYFRSSQVRVEDQSGWYLHRAGEEIKTDSFWQHRFGKIKTCWAGTNEHSMTNFYAHHKIWQHFDQHLLLNGSNSNSSISRQQRGTEKVEEEEVSNKPKNPQANASGSSSSPAFQNQHPHHHFSLREPGKVLLL